MNGDKLGLRPPIFNTKIVRVRTLPLMLWHLDSRNVLPRSQCLTTGIMNGREWLRLEFIVYNGHLQADF
eukprot:scaffold39038_cov78-Cyclotella_meneghiniana.AAC.1